MNGVNAALFLLRVIFDSLSVTDVSRICIRNKNINLCHWNHATIDSFDANWNSGVYQAAR